MQEMPKFIVLGKRHGDGNRALKVRQAGDQNDQNRDEESICRDSNKQGITWVKVISNKRVGLSNMPYVKNVRKKIT